MLPLSGIEFLVWGEVSELAGELESIQSAGLMQLGQDGVTGVPQLLRQLAGGQSGGTASDQVTDRGGQSAVFGESNPFEVPKAVPVKVG